MRLRIFTEPQEGATYDELLTLATLAEELGFDAFFRSDHYQRIHPGDPTPGPSDAWITLAGLARDTSTIRLGTLVTPVTFRWPGPLAISVAVVDAMSDGRVELGLGAGWYEGEHRAHGIPFPPTRERFEMLEEQVEIVTGMWRTPPGERYSFTGRHYDVVDSPALPKPVQQPGPPLIIGGFGANRTPRLAARYASEFNVPFAPVDAYGPVVERVHAACEAVGRDPASLPATVAQVICCATSERELQRRASAIGRSVDDLRAHALAGTPAEVVERLLAYRDAGAVGVYLQVLDVGDLDHVRLLAAEVMPKVGET